MSPLDYRIHDADNHYYEPDDCFTRHIEAAYRDATVWVDRNQPDGVGRVFHGDKRLGFFSAAVGDHVGPPGIMKEFLKGQTDEGGHVNLNPINAQEIPAFVERNARLALMDEQGVESCLMIPTMGVGVEWELRTTPEVLYPSLRSYNRWVEEDWGFGGDGRIYSCAMLSLVDLDQALTELERVAKLGARFIVLTAGPIHGHSPADPIFDPFWARIEEMGINVVYHIGATPFGEMYSKPWGARANPPSHRHSAFEMCLAFTERPVADTLMALVLDNLFGRFPKLNVLSVEYGSSWVAPLLHKMDHVARLHSPDAWRFGPLPGSPSEMFRQNVSVAPFFEDDVPTLAGVIGADRVLNGSDFPHPEGLAEPIEFLEELDGLSDGDVRRIMRDNFAALVA